MSSMRNHAMEIGMTPEQVEQFAEEVRAFDNARSNGTRQRMAFEKMAKLMLDERDHRAKLVLAAEKQANTAQLVAGYQERLAVCAELDILEKAGYPISALKRVQNTWDWYLRENGEDEG